MPAAAAPVEPEVSEARAKRNARVVLGKEVLEEVQRDRALTLLPTGFLAAPVAMGSSGHGKLSADQWRSACTIHMVFTLPRLWGFDAPGTRNYEMLDNFLHLTAATNIALSRVMSNEKAERFQYHMTTYLKGFRVLFPDAPIIPNQHLSLHMPSFLRDNGPIHPWSSLLYERINGLLQKIPTNHKLGEQSHENERRCAD